MADHDDFEDEAECHLWEHQVESAVDVADAALVKRLAPVDQAEQDSQQLRAQYATTLPYRYVNDRSHHALIRRASARIV